MQQKIASPPVIRCNTSDGPLVVTVRNNIAQLIKYKIYNNVIRIKYHEIFYKKNFKVSMFRKKNAQLSA